MDDGVAYMVMGEGGDAGQQATQVVAVDNGDGTQQLVSVFVSILRSPMTLSGDTCDGP